MSSNIRFFVKPAPGERVEAALVLPPDARSVIAGTVQLPDGAPVPNAMILAFDGDLSHPVRQAFSDENGIFFLGPLEGGRLYDIRVSHDATNVRVLEITL